MTILHIPNEQISIEGVACGEKQSVIVREAQVRHLVVMLRKSVNSLLVSEIPNDYV